MTYYLYSMLVLYIILYDMHHMPGSWSIYKMDPNLADSLKGQNEAECGGISL